MIFHATFIEALQFANCKCEMQKIECLFYFNVSDMSSVGTTVAMIAVLMPTTLPLESSSGPPELPGLRGVE